MFVDFKDARIGEGGAHVGVEVDPLEPQTAVFELASHVGLRLLDDDAGSGARRCTFCGAGGRRRLHDRSGRGRRGRRHLFLWGLLRGRFLRDGLRAKQQKEPSNREGGSERTFHEFSCAPRGGACRSATPEPWPRRPLTANGASRRAVVAGRSCRA